MDHALRMNHNFDLSGCDTKQILGLDDFQRFVHHGGRVHGDFAPHHPVGMSTGFLRGDCVQTVGISGSERAARSGKNDFVHRSRPNFRVVGQGLENSRMLAVNGQQFCPTSKNRVQKQLPTNHQRLFVGKQQTFARFGCCQARGQTCRTHNGGHHHINTFIA